MKGILLINTGSPKSKSKKDVQWFIGTMLSDPQVMTVPTIIRNVLAKGIIAPFRASSSAAHYSMIWNDLYEESPLLYNTRKLAEKIEASSSFPVEIAMRYGEPFINEAFDRLLAKNPEINQVIVVPMFPQYAQSSYQTTVDAVNKCYSENNYPFEIKIVKPYYSEYGYIHALSESLKPHIAKGYDRLIFSFHSLPLSHVEAGWSKGQEFDYVYQIKETIRLVTKELGLDPKKNRIVYSSAMGKKWLTPDLNEVVKKMPENGVKKVIALTPGFPADNLETLYDIGIVAKENFIKSGGEEFTFVPCLNSEDYWVEGLIRILISKC